MKNIEVRDSEVNISLKDIEDIEMVIKGKLPKDYKAFLLKHNGGHPIKDCYPLIEPLQNILSGDINSTDAEIAWFYAIYDGEYENFLREYQRFYTSLKKYYANFNFVPIGRSSGGNIICISIEGATYGQVYFVENEWLDAEGKTKHYFVLCLIANNFTDWVNSLYYLDINQDNNGNRIIISTHDRYSVPFSTQAKKYGAIVTGFFLKAPTEVEDYIIEETEDTKDLLLWYEVKSENKKYHRKLFSASQVFDYQV